MIPRKETSNKITWKQRMMMATLGVVVLPIGLAWFDTAEADQGRGSTTNGLEEAPETSSIDVEPLSVESQTKLPFQAAGTVAVEEEERPRVAGKRVDADWKRGSDKRSCGCGWGRGHKKKRQQ
jgi:hypothetical protein